jgi:hypothetical protein
VRARPPTPSPATSGTASSGTRCTSPLRRRPTLTVATQSCPQKFPLSVRPRSACSTSPRPERLDRETTTTTMIQKTSAPRPCSRSHQTARLALSLSPALALPAPSIDQRERREQAPVYVSRHRKSSFLCIFLCSTASYPPSRSCISRASCSVFLSALDLAVFLPRALRIAVAQCDRPLPHPVHASLCDLIIRTRLSEDYANAISFYDSPMKKKGALPAGIPRASGERNSPTGNGAFSHSQVRPPLLCIIPNHLWIAAASICSPEMRLFVMHHGPRWGDGSKV